MNEEFDLDKEDLLYVLDRSIPGHIKYMKAVASGSNRIDSICQQLAVNGLHKMTGARVALMVKMSSDAELQMPELSDLCAFIQQYTGEDVELLFGYSTNKEQPLNDELTVQLLISYNEVP